MRNVAKFLAISVLAADALAGCEKPAAQNTAAVNAAAPTEFETLPADESSGTTINELDSGVDNADVAAPNSNSD